MTRPPLGATERLYYTDSYRRVFDAQVLHVSPHARGHAVIVDRTAFFPTSGGQSHDLGTLGGAEIVDVLDDDATIVHVVTRPLEGAVHGEIDWARRFDHMQQHTGQHVLSQAARRALGAQTLSVHFGAELCTLDLDLPDLTAEGVGTMEDVANTVVFEDRPVLTRMVDETRLVELGLRRPPKKRGDVRVIEVEEFDRSACGGTHVRRTGEIGLIKVRRWERYKGGVRVEFLCGWRALHDYQWKGALVSGLAASFTVKDREVADAVSRLSGQLKERERTAADLRDRLLERETRDFLAGAPGSPKIITAVLDRSVDELLVLAGKIVATAEAAVAFATDGRLIIACSPSLGINAAAVLRSVLEPLGGRGGGRPEFAQGAVPAEAEAAAVEAARVSLERVLHA